MSLTDGNFSAVEVSEMNMKLIENVTISDISCHVLKWGDNEDIENSLNINSKEYQNILHLYRSD